MTSMAVTGKRLVFGALLLVIGGALVPSLYGQERVRTPQVTAEIIPEFRSIRPGSPLRVAIRLAVAPGWHIYWTNPGESGLATTVHWTGPAGFTAGPVRWPYPERKELGGLVVHAYEGVVVLLGELRPPAELAKQDVEINARVQWGVCREVCIPQKANLSLSFTVDSRPLRPNPRWERIAAAAAPRVPQAAHAWVMRATRAEGNLVIRATSTEEGRLPRGPLTFFPDDRAILSAAVTVVPEREGEGLTLRIRHSSPEPRRPLPTRLRGVLVARSAWDSAGRFRALLVDIPIEEDGRSGPGSLPETTEHEQQGV